MEAEKLIPSAKKFGKADTYSSIILDLEHHLEENGRLVVVISNAWLANEWGRAFKQALAHKFRIVSVVRSGSGRWFQNAEVVTTILVLEKSITGTPPSWPISFVTTNKPLPAWDDTYLAAITNASHKGVRTSDIEVNVVPFDVCEFNSDNGFHWRINFTNSDWLTALIPMTKPISDYFDVARGARTGLDDFFYPGPQDARLIEDAYLVPVVSSSKATRYLKIDADKVAFCCTLPKNELHRLGHKGALAWIEKFENRVNSTSQKPIWEHLAKSKSEWYSLDPNEQGEFAMSLNPGESLPVFRAPSPVFMNQRLTRLTSKSSDPDLLHALMNSVAGMLGMEFLGFGRGQGALDLSSNRVKDSLRMLNPQIVTPAGRAEILDAFAPLLLREFLPIGRELQEADRKHFDRVVLKNFGLESHQESMYSAIKAAVLDRSNTR
jgi:hypothetical protein